MISKFKVLAKRIKKSMTFLIVSATILGTSSGVAYATEYRLNPIASTFSNQYDIKVVFMTSDQSKLNFYWNSCKGAMDVWNTSGARICFSPYYNASGWDVECTTINDPNEDWHANSYPPIAVYPYGSITINDAHYSAFQNDIVELWAHEFGHVLGLLDVSDTTALMRSSGYRGYPQPEPDEVTGVNTLYH